MQEGELWWFDNKQYHESYNESDDWRIHYIFDLLPADYSDLAVNAVSLPAGPVKPPEPAAKAHGSCWQRTNRSPLPCGISSHRLFANVRFYAGKING